MTDDFLLVHSDSEKKTKQTELMTKFLKEKEEIKQFLNNTDNFFLDLDGVVWRGKEVIEGVKETLEFLRKKNKNLFFITSTTKKNFIKKKNQ